MAKGTAQERYPITPYPDGWYTPVAPLRQGPRFTWFADRRIPRIVVSYVVGNWISQWRQDLRIWERKSYQARPLLIQEDGPIASLRRWTRPFYGPARPRDPVVLHCVEGA